MGDASEYTYRTPLENFLNDVLGGNYDAVNEKRKIEYGKPDIAIVDKDNITIAAIETKDIDKSDLDGRGNRSKVR